MIIKFVVAMTKNAAGMWLLCILWGCFFSVQFVQGEIEYNTVNADGSFRFRHANDDIGGFYHSASASPDKIVRGRYGSRSPASGQIEETVYTAGPRGFRANGPKIHRKMDLAQYPVRPRGSPDDPLADPYDDPSYSFSFRTAEQSRSEENDANNRVRGLYSYLDDVGERHSVRYAAGAGTGFEVLNAVPDNPINVGYASPLYKAHPKTRGKMSVQRGPAGSYKLIAAGPDHRRAESRGTDGLVRGTYSFLDDKGVQRTVEYIAGAGIGYRVVKNRVGLGTHVNPSVADFRLSDADFRLANDFGRGAGGALGAGGGSSGSGVSTGPGTGGGSIASGGGGGGVRGGAGSRGGVRGGAAGGRGGVRAGGSGSSSGGGRTDYGSSGSGGSGGSSSSGGDGGNTDYLKPAGTGAEDADVDIDDGNELADTDLGYENEGGGNGLDESHTDTAGARGKEDRRGLAMGSRAGGSGGTSGGGSYRGRGGTRTGTGNRAGSGISGGGGGTRKSGNRYGSGGSGSGSRRGDSNGAASGEAESGYGYLPPPPSNPSGPDDNYSFNDDDVGGSLPPLVTANHRILEIERDRAWVQRHRDSTIIKNVGKWYVGLPPGHSVRAHVQNIDIVPLGGRILSPSEALRQDEMAELHASREH